MPWRMGKQASPHGATLMAVLTQRVFSKDVYERETGAWGMFNKYIEIALVVAFSALCVKLYYFHSSAVEAARKAGRDEVVQEYSKEYVLNLEKQLTASQGLLEKSTKSLKDKDDLQKADSIRYQRIIDGLRSRPRRSETVVSSPDSTSSPCSNTGAGLSREDSEFLAGEASTANQIVRERDYYYQSLKELTEELGKLNGKK